MQAMKNVNLDSSESTLVYWDPQRTAPACHTLLSCEWTDSLSHLGYRSPESSHEERAPARREARHEPAAERGAPQTGCAATTVPLGLAARLEDEGEQTQTCWLLRENKNGLTDSRKEIHALSICSPAVPCASAWH